MAIRIGLKYRRNDDGDYCTIEHHTKSEREAKAWISRMVKALEKEGDEYKGAMLYWEKEDEEQ